MVAVSIMKHVFSFDKLSEESNDNNDGLLSSLVKEKAFGFAHRVENRPYHKINFSRYMTILVWDR